MVLAPSSFFIFATNPELTTASPSDHRSSRAGVCLSPSATHWRWVCWSCAICAKPHNLLNSGTLIIPVPLGRLLYLAVPAVRPLARMFHHPGAAGLEVAIRSRRPRFDYSIVEGNRIAYVTGRKSWLVQSARIQFACWTSRWKQRKSARRTDPDLLCRH